MAEINKKREIVDVDIDNAYNKIKSHLANDWGLVFENKSGKQAELMYLTGMFSGAGVLGLFSHGARKSLLFIKLVAHTGTETEITVITGGSETVWGLDFGRHENNINHVLELFEEEDAPL